MDILPHLIVFGAALVQAAAGIGFAMICVPLLALIDIALVPGPMLVAMICLSLFMALGGRRAIEPGEFKMLVPGLLAGTVAGAFVLTTLDRTMLSLAFGLIVLIAVAVTASGVSARLNRANLAAGAIASGLMGIVAGIHGPPLAVLYARARPEKARATIAWIFVLASVMALIGLAFAGRFDRADMITGLSLAPAALIGLALARQVRNRMSLSAVRTAMLSVTALSALTLIVNTWRQMG